MANDTVNWTGGKGILKHLILPEQGLSKISTPKQQDGAYLCLWDPSLQLTMGWDAGVPSLKSIHEDMARIPNYSILKRIKARGAVVHGWLGLAKCEEIYVAAS
eukprot:7933132-Ditylum_brightwellii.AAC.1